MGSHRDHQTPASAVEARSIARRPGEAEPEYDLIAVEAPLSIVVEHGPSGAREQTTVATTMRTPGDDEALAMGWLTAEEVLRPRDVEAIRLCATGLRVRVLLREGTAPRLEGAVRRSVITSSCGICGRDLIDAIPKGSVADVATRLTTRALFAAARGLAQAQPGFRHTGGLHAAGLFHATQGSAPDAATTVDVREDVGRHNALDKLVGAQLLDGDRGRVRLRSGAIVMSSRASYELVQKTCRAGAAVLATVGAPSTLAIDAADRAGMTLVGFLRDERMNLYTRPDRIAE